MKTITFALKSASPYGQSKAYTEPAKEDKESPADYEKRTWRERMHATEFGYIFIPPMVLKIKTHQENRRRTSLDSIFSRSFPRHSLCPKSRNIRSH